MIEEDAKPSQLNVSFAIYTAQQLQKYQPRGIPIKKNNETTSTPALFSPIMQSSLLLAAFPLKLTRIVSCSNVVE